MQNAPSHYYFQNYTHMKTTIITNIKKKYFILFFAAISSLTMAQESPSISFSGSIDAYFRGNLNAPNDENAIAQGSSFANLPGFSLGMANIIASYEGENFGAVADLVFGPRGTDAIFASPMYSLTGSILNQLYVYWSPSESVTFTMGNFNTFLGYEVISPSGNFNYSTSYLFSYGPFSHTGLKVDFDLGNDWSAMLGVFNPTDLTEFNPTGDYAFGAQLGYAGQYLNALSSQGGFEIDYTGGFNASESFYVGINAAHYSESETDISFSGFALYPQISMSETSAFGVRAEYFAETGYFGAIGASDADGDSSVFALTLTANFDVGALSIKPELRFDNASEEAFINNTADPSKSLSTFFLATVLSF